MLAIVSSCGIYAGQSDTTEQRSEQLYQAGFSEVDPTFDTNGRVDGYKAMMGLCRVRAFFSQNSYVIRVGADGIDWPSATAESLLRLVDYSDCKEPDHEVAAA